MSDRIACYTLFDITQTNVLNRNKPVGDDIHLWTQQRNSQANFDTILQCIGLRANPEIRKYPHKKYSTSANKLKHDFGFLINNDTNIWYWKFEFTVSQLSVYDNETDSLGYLTQDCHEVPMLTCGTEAIELPNFLDTTPELRNIYFKRIK
jgi:hypothetical protein